MERDITERLIHWGTSSSRKPLILSGARQVGKTYILKRYGADFFKKYHYINFEKEKHFKKIFLPDFDTKRIVKELELALQNKITIGKDILIFDEIQECPEALTSLKYFCEEEAKLHIACAGSLLGVTLSGQSFPVGKVDRLCMGPLNFSEFLKGIGKDALLESLKEIIKNKKSTPFIHESLLEQFRLFSVVGGMPAAINTYKENENDLLLALEKVRKIHHELIKDYLDDISKHAGKINALHIRAVFDNISVQMGKNLEDGVKKYIFKDILPSKRGYAELRGPIEWLERASLINRIKICNKPELPLEAFCKESVFKVYFFDTGLLGAMFGLPTELMYSQNYGQTKGVFAENLTLQLLWSGTNFREKQVYAWEQNTSEIEFVVVSQYGIIPVEVKAGHNTKAKSLVTYIKRYNPKVSVIISNRPISFDREKQRLLIPVYCAEFLQELL